MMARKAVHVPKVFETLKETEDEKSFILELLGKVTIFVYFFRIRSGPPAVLPQQYGQADPSKDSPQNSSKPLAHLNLP
jgi:hypothetical protein